MRGPTGPPDGAAEFHGAEDVEITLSVIVTIIPNGLSDRVVRISTALFPE